VRSQKNGAVSKVNTKFISQLTREKRTPLAAETVHVFHALQQFAYHAYCGAAWPVSKMASQQEKAFCMLRFEVSRSVITVQREFCARFRTTGSACTPSSSTVLPCPNKFLVNFWNRTFLLWTPCIDDRDDDDVMSDVVLVDSLNANKILVYSPRYVACFCDV
jgi:hypothetical protein